MPKMTLASDAISHVALPGIAIALPSGVHSVPGGLATLLLGTLLIRAVESRHAHGDRDGDRRRVLGQP